MEKGKPQGIYAPLARLTAIWFRIQVLPLSCTSQHIIATDDSTQPQLASNSDSTATNGLFRDSGQPYQRLGCG